MDTQDATVDGYFYVGQKFSSYAELSKFINEFEILKKQKFTKKRSRKITAAAKSETRSLKRPMKAALEYYELEYACIHGQERSSRGKGLRQTSTLRMGCKANFKLRVCSSGQYLEVQSSNLEHTGHELSETVFDQLHCSRSLNEIETKSVATYLALGANKKKIQNKILTDTGKKTTLKDLHNIYSKHKVSQNNLVEAVNLLKNKYGCNVNVFADEKQQFKALAFSTENMRNAMEAWPEFVSFDGTYKLLNIGCTLFLFLVEDSNGQSEVVFAVLISVEDKDTYRWIFNTFKSEMETKGIQCFMGDKDFSERDVVHELFPGTPVYLCLFHTLKTFKREINCDKLNITKEERDLSLEYLQKLVYSKNEEEYTLMYIQFKECVPPSVLHYFDKNWHSIRNEWCVFEMTACNMKNTTNNRMESINQKIKSVIPKNSSLIEFIKTFFIFLDSQYQERDNKAAKHILKRALKRFEDHEEDMEEYRRFLTNYAFNYIEKQVNYMTEVKILDQINDQKCIVKTSKGTISVSIVDCQCGDFMSMMLPCRHILSVRKFTKLPLFVPEICHVRWTRVYYLSKQRIGQICTGKVSKPTCTTSQKSKTMTLTEKRKSATLVTNSLVQLLSIASGSDFEYKLDVLKKIEHIWKSGKEVTLNILGNPDTDVSDVTNNETNGDEGQGSSRHRELQVTTESGTDELSVGQEAVNENIILFDGFVYDLNNKHLPEQDKVREVEEVHSTDSERTNLPEDEIAVVESIILPPKIKMKGRPKGHDLTTIGLKKKRNKMFPVKYQLKSTTSKLFYIISIICKENTLITEESIEAKMLKINAMDLQEELPDAILDPSVDFENLNFQEYFEKEAWDSFQIKFAEKQGKNKWSCKYCSNLLENEPSIVCESCLFWYHLKCSALKKIPAVKTWFCNRCYRKHV